MTCIVFNDGKPFRKPLYTNIWFTVALILTIAMSLYIMLADSEWNSTLF